MTNDQNGGAFPTEAVQKASGVSSAALELDGLAERVADLVAERVQLGSAPALIDAEAAGRMLGVPASWLLAEARARRVPHVRLGKYVRFSPGELRAWIDERGSGPRARTGSQPVSPRRGAA